MAEAQYFVERVDHEDGSIAYEIMKRPYEWITAFSERDRSDAKAVAQFFCDAANKATEVNA